MFCVIKNKENLTLSYENYFFNYNLDFLTKFPLEAKEEKIFCKKIFLNFGFKEINFEKKQMILYFFLMELLTNQKCILTTSRKNLINLKLKKGSVVGCKVTLQHQHLYSFLDLLVICLPRSEIFKGFFFKEKSLKKNTYSTQLKNLFIFYPVESDILNSVKTLDISFTFNASIDFDKFFFFTYYKIPLNFI
jgi:large subunit ribosomal protein L5